MGVTARRVQAPKRSHPSRIRCGFRSIHATEALRARRRRPRRLRRRRTDSICHAVSNPRSRHHATATPARFDRLLLSFLLEAGV